MLSFVWQQSAWSTMTKNNFIYKQFRKYGKDFGPMREVIRKHN